MKTLLQILAPVLAAVLGYAVAGAFRPAEEKARVEPAATPAPERAPAPSTLRGERPVDAIANILTALSGTPSLADFTAAREALERLTPAQMGDLLQRALTMRLRSGATEAERAERVSLLMRAWTARDPNAATEWMRPRLEKYARLPGFGSDYFGADAQLLNAWARGAPKIALEIARNYPRSELGYQLLQDAIYASPDKDYAARFALLHAFPPGSARQRMMRSLLDGWSRSDPAAALAALGTMAPDAERTEALRTLLVAAPGRDPAGTLAQAEAFGMADDHATLLRLAMAVGAKAPQITKRWLEARGPELLRKGGGALVLAWAEHNPRDAFGWAQKHGIDIGAAVLAGADSGTRNWAMSRGFHHDSPIKVALEKKPEVVLGWLRKQPPGAARDAAVLTTLGAMREPQEMAPLLAMLPPEAQPQGAEAIAAKFTGMGSEVGIEWARTLPAGPTRTAGWTALGKARGAVIPPKLPPGPDRDAFMRGSTQTTYYVQGFPEKVMERALSIDDSALRRQTFDEVMGSWTTNPKHRESAAPWLNQAAVPEAWKTQWRERLR